ncbi:hypothetical protein LB516_20515 [Mesorhizobium sp. CO1-1-7]|nr:hypothetical protein [Mesorhizobium sp. CO1-1-7]MBZ9747636.1 hypothetical protein [Mesorhizobium sp. CO1-1-7]
MAQLIHPRYRFNPLFTEENIVMKGSPNKNAAIRLAAFFHQQALAPSP